VSAAIRPGNRLGPFSSRLAGRLRTQCSVGEPLPPGDGSEKIAHVSQTNAGQDRRNQTAPEGGWPESQWLTPPLSALPRYGIDAPDVPAVLTVSGLAFLVAGTRRRRWLLPSAALLAQAALFMHTTLCGKFLVWERELDQLELRGDEHLLDVGCGRGAVLIAAARRLPAGRAVGIDLWRGLHQLGNDMAVARANAKAEGVADRVELYTADMTELPFPDASFDVVTSALAVHNVRTAEGRHRALDEAVRVLRPGGRLLLADWHHSARDYCRYLGSAAASRPLGPGYWYGGPWAATTMITMTKA
jgi:SAM-dependent methyltransferase